jgi:dienelactone hydrolase
VLVHGSGPQDRDETIGPNKPFRDLAWGLASQGIAVLRYEKRTKKHAMKLVLIKNTITVKQETIDDALAAVALLRKTERIDPNRIFVLGHSLGGMLIPRIGARDPDVAHWISQH